MRPRAFRFVLIVLLLGFPVSVFAKGPREVSYKLSSGEVVHGLLYEPAGQGRHPGIVVIHEWWGLNDWIKEQAQAFASRGYVTLAVDLYRGKVAKDAETAHELMRGLPQDRGVENVVAAAGFLASQPNVRADRIGAVGWCMGGGYAALLAVNDPHLRAVAINYGSLPDDRAELARIHAAVLGNFGGLDRGITPEDVHAFERSMHSLGKPVDVKIYPDAGHAFENPNNQGGYRAADAADAQARIRAFFRQELQ